MKTIKELRDMLKSTNNRGAWNIAVKDYALELIGELPDDYEFCGSPADRKSLLNGAQDWRQYSGGGCSLIYDQDIAERLCSPSELKKTRNGERNPNGRENWLDAQARALFQAERLILRLCR